MQRLAINSLAMYTSVAHAFCIVAPPLVHADTSAVCDIETYHRRLWCRTENFCHMVRHGVHTIWMSTSPTECVKMFEEGSSSSQFAAFVAELSVPQPGHASASEEDAAPHQGQALACRQAFLAQNLRVFEADCTVGSDKLELVAPFLGLYAEIFAATVAEKIEGRRTHTQTGQWVMHEMTKYKSEIFPSYINMLVKDAITGKEEMQEVPLFGELVSLMERRIERNEAQRNLLVSRFAELEGISEAGEDISKVMATVRGFQGKMASKVGSSRSRRQYVIEASAAETSATEESSNTQWWSFISNTQR